MKQYAGEYMHYMQQGGGHNQQQTENAGHSSLPSQASSAVTLVATHEAKQMATGTGPGSCCYYMGCGGNDCDSPDDHCGKSAGNCGDCGGSFCLLSAGHAEDAVAPVELVALAATTVADGAATPAPQLSKRQEERREDDEKRAEERRKDDEKRAKERREDNEQRSEQRRKDEEARREARRKDEEQRSEQRREEKEKRAEKHDATSDDGQGSINLATTGAR